MSKANAGAILAAESAADRQQLFDDLRVFNSTKTTYADALAAGDARLFGERIGAVAANGQVQARVPRHAATVFRLRAIDATHEKLVKQEL